jgi:hypothetical protein
MRRESPGFRHIHDRACRRRHPDGIPVGKVPGREWPGRGVEEDAGWRRQTASGSRHGNVDGIGDDRLFPEGPARSRGK